MIDSISFKKINSQTIQETRTFQTVSKENKITNLMLKGHSTSDSLQLFINLCPRLEQLSLDTSRHELTLIIQNLFLNNEIRPINLTFLCFLNSNEVLKRIIAASLPSDWPIKSFSNNIYVWC